MDNSKRMAMTQAKGAGAPPQDPPQAPPDASGASPGGDGGGMPDPSQVIPQIAEALNQMAQQLPDEQKQLVMSAAQQLQSAFPTDPSKSGGMSPEDNAAYGEQSPM